MTSIHPFSDNSPPGHCGSNPISLNLIYDFRNSLNMRSSGQSALAVAKTDYEGKEGAVGDQL